MGEGTAGIRNQHAKPKGGEIQERRRFGKICVFPIIRKGKTVFLRLIL